MTYGERGTTSSIVKLSQTALCHIVGSLYCEHNIVPHNLLNRGDNGLPHKMLANNYSDKRSAYILQTGVKSSQQ